MLHNTAQYRQIHIKLVYITHSVVLGVSTTNYKKYPKKSIEDIMIIHVYFVCFVLWNIFIDVSH